MACVEFLPDVYEDLRRVFSHLEQHEAEHIPDRLREIVSAPDVLVDNPMVGRPQGGDLRELVIGRGCADPWRFTKISSPWTPWSWWPFECNAKGVMQVMHETEADTRANRIDPLLRDAGWGVADGSHMHREWTCPGRIPAASTTRPVQPG